MTRNRSSFLRVVLVVALGGLPSFGAVAQAQAPPDAPTIQILDGDGYINAAEAGAVKARGTADAEYEVAVSFDDADNDTTTPVVTIAKADINGNYTTANVDLRVLDDGTITATATEVAIVAASVTPSSDVPLTVRINEHPAISESEAATSIKDASLPITTLGVEHDDPGLNAADIAALSVVSGDTEDFATVTVKVNGTTVATPTANASGRWETAPLNLASYSDGTLTFTARAKDAAGNLGPIVTRLVDKFTLPPGTPTVAFVEIIGDANLDATEIHAVRLDLSGPVGTTVRATITDSDPVTPNHIYEIAGTGAVVTTAPQDLSDQADPLLTATAVAIDAVGNASAPDIATIGKSTGAPPPAGIVEILDNPLCVGPTCTDQEPVPGDDPTGVDDGFVDEIANIEETDAGTDLQVLVYLDNATNPTELFSVNVKVTDGTTTITSATKTLAKSSSQRSRTFSLDVTTLADGPITATAYVTNVGGNTSGASDTSLLDLTPPATIDITGPGETMPGFGVVFIPFFLTSVEISGTVKDTTTSILVVNVCGENTSNGDRWGCGQALPIGGPGQLQADFLKEASGLSDGHWIFSAYGMDEAGNMSTTGASVEFDVSNFPF